VGEGAVSDERIDPKPALGTPASPAFGEKTGEKVALHIGEWRDGRWSYLYGEDTGYLGPEADLEDVREAARTAREGELPKIIQGPIINPPVWTWEVPLYFWFGGIAAGSSFVALACDLVGDERSAAVARKVALGALGPSPVLLILDLGRPERFVNMLRIFKPRSPMSMGAWALTLFGNLAAAAVGADLLGRRRLAKRLGAANALVGGYLGSYTGVLLASTAVPVWARSRLFLGPIFVSTAAATGAAACRLALVADGMPVGHPTRNALGTVETGAMTAELVLSIVNERKLGALASGLSEGRPGTLFKLAKWAVRVGLALRFARSRGPWVHHAASVLYLAAGLAFRFAWVGAGRRSAQHDAVVAQMARERKSGS
jgi:formate-dependent nitrite reductase membrane component NrfD